MKMFAALISSFLVFTPTCLTASEPSNGTLIMLGSLSGWMVLSTAFVLKKKSALQVGKGEKQ